MWLALPFKTLHSISDEVPRGTALGVARFERRGAQEVYVISRCPIAIMKHSASMTNQRFENRLSQEHELDDNSFGDPSFRIEPVYERNCLPW